MSQELATRPNAGAIAESVLIGGDLKNLSESERATYYLKVCDSVGLNPLTRPFEYLMLNGKLQLYARKDCTDQLRAIHDVSIKIVGRELVDDVYVVTAQATKPGGRADESIGAVPIGNLKGDGKANAIMKAETKSKRRVTLSICGLGMLDETEIETIPGHVNGQAKPQSEIDHKKVAAFNEELANAPGLPEVKEIWARIVAADKDLPDKPYQNALKDFKDKVKAYHVEQAERIAAAQEGSAA